MCDSDKSLVVLARVTTACEETARRARPGRLTGEEVLFGMAAKIPKRRRVINDVHWTSKGDWPGQ